MRWMSTPPQSSSTLRASLDPQREQSIAGVILSLEPKLTHQSYSAGKYKQQVLSRYATHLTALYRQLTCNKFYSDLSLPTSILILITYFSTNYFSQQAQSFWIRVWIYFFVDGGSGGKAGMFRRESLSTRLGLRLLGKSWAMSCSSFWLGQGRSIVRFNIMEGQDYFRRILWHRTLKTKIKQLQLSPLKIIPTIFLWHISSRTKCKRSLDTKNLISNLQQSSQLLIMHTLIKLSFRTSQRKLIEPQLFALQTFEDWFKVSSANYQFLIAKKPPSEFIYTHRADTPAGVLKKPAIHIIPESVPELNRKQKWAAVTRILENKYEDSFKSCKSGAQVFHLERRIKSDIRTRLSFIGCIQGKYKHLLTFKSFLDINAEVTQKQYQKKGVQVDVLNATIYPTGKVWMPTSQKYLEDYVKIINSISGKDVYHFLDLGCGSGILSFLFAKRHKKSKITAIDKNPDAVKTTNVNAVKLNLSNVEALQFDLICQKDFQLKTMQAHLPKKFDYIVINPPWMSASKLQGQSVIAEGVYDKQSKMLQNSLKLAKRLLAKDGRIIVIYSDLSQLIGLTKKTVESFSLQNELLVESKEERPLQEELGKHSALQQFKSKAKIQTYVLRHS